MKVRWKVAGCAALFALLAGALVTMHRLHISIRQRGIILLGAVIQHDDDPRKELPIADVEISVADGLAASNCKSDSSGFFRLVLRPGLALGEPVTLLFRHPGYKPLALNETAGTKICIARMVPVSHEAGVGSIPPEVVVANVRVRYSTKAMAEVNVGSAVKTFQIVNTGNVPCNGGKPCSPDGKWKATAGSLSLNAGQGNEFRNARVSCIAGPCPFSKIESSNVSHDGRTFTVSALCWSDTTTFLLEAEIDRRMVNDIVRESYPVAFGEALNFTLPEGAEGASVEAEMNGEPIVFPLGPDLFLSWAECNARFNGAQTRVYRCKLKPGYRFR